ncbi:MAG: type II toxin-antitoxin system mRNA interferase toxin, RelE/StbE family [Armatimonadetes bacterium CG07_land_8_20_14_0_80_59_28]|nr:MAG: type II toxin-antitoxin system mRNA interferase toxin, RelE/StbE family [Armatimonadetes bacterium CG07_land_8_20_14_0_80_59_28]PJB67513.1 MAG: type II toxin-antitoxin system mRNA interferase toxin, RelE/StbE family [Armatimonadetes bacterium CG_4_9_14_3_um_filter_58_7]
MRPLSWSPSFQRALRRYLRRHPDAQAEISEALRCLAENPFSPALDTHKLRGKLTGLWACSVAYDCRIVFDFVNDPLSKKEVILLTDLGSHEDVY